VFGNVPVIEKTATEYRRPTISYGIGVVLE
jgi:hypothetical protein